VEAVTKSSAVAPAPTLATTARARFGDRATKAFATAKAMMAAEESHVDLAAAGHCEGSEDGSDHHGGVEQRVGAHTAVERLIRQQWDEHPSVR
jgi:hypothetical protein